MTIEQILPELLRLSRVDKVKVVQRLVGELTAEESVPIIALKFGIPIKQRKQPKSFFTCSNRRKPMMPVFESFPFLPEGSATSSPRMPFRLSRPGIELPVTGLLDTGASLNVLPYSVGTRLGLVWDEQSVPVQLAGNLAASEARAIILIATIGEFPPKRLAFAWSRAESIPIILG